MKERSSYQREKYCSAGLDGMEKEKEEATNGRSTAIFQEKEKRMWRKYQRDKNRRITRQGKGEGRREKVDRQLNSRGGEYSWFGSQLRRPGAN
jgi:hypothetical protein